MVWANVVNRVLTVLAACAASLVSRNGPMDWTWTIVALVACFALAALFGWRGAQPPDLHRGPRLIPYRFLMLIAALGVLLMLIHLASLAGLRQDRS